MFSVILVVFSVCLIQVSKGQIITFDITPIDTDKEGEYVCYKFPLDTFEEAYLDDTTLEIKDHNVVHHASVGFCEQPLTDSVVWKCNDKHTKVIHTCKGASTSLIGWKPPKDAGIALGKSTRYKYAIVEVHYGAKTKASSEPVARITLSLKTQSSKHVFQTHTLLTSGYIPANEKRGYFSEVACPWKRPPVRVYQYNAHTHGHGIMVEGYLIRNGTWILLGGPLIKGHVYDPTAYDVVSGPITLRQGDVLAARCLFRNDSPQPVPFGLNEEMCVFQLVFGYDKGDDADFARPLACVSDAQEFSFCNHKQTSAICERKNSHPFM